MLVLVVVDEPVVVGGWGGWVSIYTYALRLFITSPGQRLIVSGPSGAPPGLPVRIGAYDD